ncbi:DUF2842 domain-containing protein [Thermopetrobacter sp. TC1]|uniref:DUF2842 domain-containing protein n=1 Tax=Thermopetrobacter sp. TC1 TaxID=1495045 RepID=UPI00056E3126|nr:DUF2842 domain-containing protein [Thermopetrobacter sp. TC1]
MSQNLRKFLGIPLMLVYLVTYVLVMMALGATLAGYGVSEWVRFFYHAVAGFAWLPGAMWIIRWMVKPDGKRSSGRR